MQKSGAWASQGGKNKCLIKQRIQRGQGSSLFCPIINTVIVVTVFICNSQH